MTRIVIAGGGGFGLELHGYIAADIVAGRLPGCVLAGLLDDGESCQVSRKLPELPHLGSLQEYQACPNEAVVIAVGQPESRQKMARVLYERGARLLTYVHYSAWLAASASLEDGIVICPNSLVNAGAVVERNVLINVFCSVGHGAWVGEHSVLSPYCSVSGDAQLGGCCFMGTRATILPKVNLGRNCIVDAHTAVKKSMPDNKIVSARGRYIEVDRRVTPSFRPNPYVS